MDYDDLMKEIREDLNWEASNAVRKNVVSFKEGDPMVNRPSHYTSGKTEVIDIIEDAIKDAPNVNSGFLQGQVLKYLLRMWLKDDPKQDAEKAQWYLKRMIEGL